MIGLLFLVQYFTFSIDIVHQGVVYHGDCLIVPTNNALIEYDLTTNNISATIDCDFIFSDEFED